MRKLVVTENITLDGVIDASEGWFAPAGDEEVDQSDLNETLREQAAAADAVLFGRARCRTRSESAALCCPAT